MYSPFLSEISDLLGKSIAKKNFHATHAPRALRDGPEKLNRFPEIVVPVHKSSGYITVYVYGCMFKYCIF